jgi:hypothetical protein
VDFGIFYKQGNGKIAPGKENHKPKGKPDPAHHGGGPVKDSVTIADCRTAALRLFGRKHFD